MRTKSLLLLIISLLFFTIILAFYFSLPSSKIENKETFTPSLALCEDLKGAIRSRCEELIPACPLETFEFFSCMARGVATLDINVSHAMCFKSNLSYERKIECFANALAMSNIEEARKECDLIEDVNSKIFCKANSIKFVNVEEALKECEAFEDVNQKFLCKAMAVSIRSKEEAKNYCLQIKEEENRKKCLEMF